MEGPVTKMNSSYMTINIEEAAWRIAGLLSGLPRSL